MPHWQEMFVQLSPLHRQPISPIKFRIGSCRIDNRINFESKNVDRQSLVAFIRQIHSYTIDNDEIYIDFAEPKSSSWHQRRTVYNSKSEPKKRFWILSPLIKCKAYFHSIRWRLWTVWVYWIRNSNTSHDNGAILRSVWSGAFLRRDIFEQFRWSHFNGWNRRLFEVMMAITESFNCSTHLADWFKFDVRRNQAQAYELISDFPNGRRRLGVCKWFTVGEISFENSLRRRSN